MPATASRRRWRPRWTLRLRLTLLYGGLFLVAGTALLAITYGLVANSSDVATANQVFVDRTAAAGKLPALPADAFAVPPDVRGTGQAAGAVAQSVGGTQSPAVVQLRAYAGKVTACSSG